MNIIYKKLSEIKPYENNPRHNDVAVEQVANSIKEFGWKQPIVIDKSGVIVVGHTRYKAAERLGLTDVPCVIADDLTDEQIKAYRLADNKTGELSTWDFELLDIELDGVLDIDMSNFGFDLNRSESMENDSFYSDKVEGLFYEPNEEKPKIEELVDENEYNNLISKNKQSTC